MRAGSQRTSASSTPPMTQRFVEYRGFRMIEGWPERIQAAQLVPTYDIEGAERPRIRYGDESEDWGADRNACYDCRVLAGELHVPGCDAEECPVCHVSILSCDCRKAWEEDDVDDDTDDDAAS
jgi:hypothetical protein